MLTVGQPAPQFSLPNQDGRMIRLEDFRGKKVVLFAFPKANTLGCNAQACGFNDELPAITSSNAVLLGLSNDSLAELKKWKQSKKLQYDLLCDSDHQVLEAYGAWGMEFGFIKLSGGINRSYWVIDENGILIDQQVGISPGASIRKAVAALNQAEALAR